MTLKGLLRYFIAITSLFALTAHAESELDLAKAIQNPLGVNEEARHIVVPFENYTNFDYADNSTQNIFYVKPIIPLTFTPSYDLVFRSIIPYTHQPTGNGYVNGLGDINPTLFLTPAGNNWFLWGAGPTVIMPTATNKLTGAGKWSVGPELVLVAMPQQWSLAILTNNVWSVAGNTARQNVNLFTFEYFITYNFPHGWYVTTQPTLTANWFAASGQKWVVPFGIGAGRTMQLGTQAMNLSVQGYYNAIRPHGNSSWQLEMNIAFLFPDSQTMRLPA